jgi:hypothetical protein
MATFSLFINYSNDISTDCKIHYEKIHKYKVSLGGETREFNSLDDLIKHFEGVIQILCTDLSVQEVLFVIPCYPNLTLSRSRMKLYDNQELLKNLISFEFRNI